jgi:hypothetical protein
MRAPRWDRGAAEEKSKVIKPRFSNPRAPETQDLVAQLDASRCQLDHWTALLERAAALRDRMAAHSPLDPIQDLIEIERDAAELRLLLSFESFKARRSRR